MDGASLVDDFRTDEHKRLGAEVQIARTQIMDHLEANQDEEFDVADLLDISTTTRGPVAAIAFFNLADEGLITWTEHETCFLATQAPQRRLEKIRAHVQAKQDTFRQHRDAMAELSREIGELEKEYFQLKREHPELT